MKLLQDHLSPGRFYLFDPATGLQPAPAGTFVDEASTPVHGLAQSLAEGPFVFYNDGAQLVVWTKETGAIPLGVGTTAEYQADRAHGRKRFAVKRRGSTIHERWYADPVDPPMSDDYTSAEEEDFDLPLFAANVLTSPDRKRFFELRWG